MIRGPAGGLKVSLLRCQFLCLVDITDVIVLHHGFWRVYAPRGQSGATLEKVLHVHSRAARHRW